MSFGSNKSAWDLGSESLGVACSTVKNGENGAVFPSPPQLLSHSDKRGHRIHAGARAFSRPVWVGLSLTLSGPEQSFKGLSG